IAEKHKRAKAGEDFAEMCVKENDTRMFASAKPFESAPSSFAIVKIRDVLKTLPPGQVSEVIEDKGTFYVVKVEARQEGRTRAFDEPRVQDDIRNRLRAAQYSALRQAERVKLARTALIRMDAEMLNIAVEMAMQKYGQYAAAK
ncbi:MAG: peptidylprolyl isomerase, partial [Phycisphaerae bacterium]